jgi:Tfp pilus assembly protein PilN
MSQVNLLPPEILAAQRQRRMAGVVVLAGIGVIGLILVFYFIQISALSGVQSDIEAAEQNNAGLQRDIQELQEFQALREQAQAKQALLNQVFANEISFSGLLMDLSRVIPSDAALTSFTATATDPTPTTGGSTLLMGRIDVAGLAFDYQTIASWLTGLERVRGWANPWVTSIADPETGPITYSSGVDLTLAAVTQRGQLAGGVVSDAG